MGMDMKALSRRILEEGFGKGRLDVADEIVAANHVDHDPANPQALPNGPAGLKQIIQLYRGAFPDLRMTVDDQISEGDRVVTRWTARGTHRGMLGDLPPTGRTAIVVGITIDRIAGGKIVESWSNWDQAGMLQQLGAMPRQRTSETRASQPHA